MAEGAIRAFVAVPLAGEAATSLAARLEEIEREGPRGALRLVPAHQLHFTLKFMPALAEARLPAVIAALASAAAGASRFTLELAGLGTFPPSARARVLWLGCAAGRLELEELAGRVEAELVAAGLPAEERPFKAHLTLGRVKDPRHGREVARLAESFADLAIGSLDVHELVLYRSVLGQGGASHTPLSRVPLRA